MMGDLSDQELRTKLMARGCIVGPITDSTRRVYVAKLHSLESKENATSSRPRAKASSHVAGGVAHVPSRVPKLIHKKDWEQDYKKPLTVEGTLTVLQSTLPCQSSPPSTSSQPNLPLRPASHSGPCRAEGMADMHALLTSLLPLPPAGTGSATSV